MSVQDLKNDSKTVIEDEIDKNNVSDDNETVLEAVVHKVDSRSQKLNISEPHSLQPDGKLSHRSGFDSVRQIDQIIDSSLSDLIKQHSESKSTNKKSIFNFSLKSKSNNNSVNISKKVKKGRKNQKKSSSSSDFEREAQEVSSTGKKIIRLKKTKMDTRMWDRQYEMWLQDKKNNPRPP